MSRDTAFDFTAAPVRFGAGVTREIGAELADRGLRHVLVFVDPALTGKAPAETVFQSLHDSGVTFAVFDRIQIEPTAESWQDAIETAGRQTFDAIVALGGGSTIDTAKAANIYTSHPPADFYDYVNAPVGKGLAVPGPLKPLFAVPTTAGTGSETTGVCVFDDTSRRVKTAVASRWMKPALAFLDPENTRTQPAGVAASAGLDILCHAVESYTARSFTDRPRPERPGFRPGYQGANPISDVWSLQSLRMLAKHFVRAVADPADDEARGQMMLAASYAGIGFGTAGVHLPHAMSYPVAGRVREFRARDYPSGHALVPHGISVILNAPAAFRFTSEASPRRHLEAAEALGADVSGAPLDGAGEILADRIRWFMQALQVPARLRDVGYSTSDVPALVEGALLQQRLIGLTPRSVDAEALGRLFESSI